MNYRQTYEDKLVVLAVEIVKVVSPQIFRVACVDKAMAVCSLFDKHVRWQVLRRKSKVSQYQTDSWQLSYIKIPISRNLNKTRVLTCNERLHPFFGRLLVVNLGPLVASPQIVGLAVVMAHAVVILDAVREE